MGLVGSNLLPNMVRGMYNRLIFLYLFIVVLCFGVTEQDAFSVRYESTFK